MVRVQALYLQHSESNLAPRILDDVVHVRLSHGRSGDTNDYVAVKIDSLLDRCLWRVLLLLKAFRCAVLMIRNLL